MQNNPSDFNFSKKIIEWYKLNKRDLPWRNINDPYKIWISEIILQQTRVNQGMNYYLRFIERFPTVSSLANASEDDVLKYWQGLGYYSRARNIHKAAKQINSTFSGKFPLLYKDVISLAGIGEYTAAAICSFAYNLPYSVVDGNVYRVLSRVFNIDTPIDTSKGKKEFSTLAQSLLNTDKPGIHNQAIMEFGALQCTPTSPDCFACPLSNNCIASYKQLINQLPVKTNKTKVSNRYFNYLFIELEGATFLQKRVKKDIWQNLYEFPLIESTNLLSTNELLINTEFHALFEGIKKIEVIKKTNPMKHVLSHRVIYAQFISIRISEPNEKLKDYIRVPLDKIDDFVVSRLMELFIENNFN